jgi:hypothetical protein
VAGRSRGAWAKLVGQWRESGLTRKEFAGRHRLKEKTLQWWAWNLKHETSPATVARPLEFVEVTPLHAACEPFQIHLGNGAWVAVPTDFDDVTLARLLRVMRTAS